MDKAYDRRSFCGRTIGTMVALQAPTPAIGSKNLKKIYSEETLEEFSLDEVTVDPTSELAARMRRNTDYLLSLDIDRLLYSFRSYAGIAQEAVKPYGGWEAPTSGVRGHFVGHYLSAVAAASRSMNALDAPAARECERRANALVAGLNACQNAIALKTGPDSPGRQGYLNAQSPAQFDRLEALQPCDVPYYIIHKIMAGLLDAHDLIGSTSALGVAARMGDYFAWRMSRLSPQRIAAMTETRRYRSPIKTYFMEFGGMQEVALRLHQSTGQPAHLMLAGCFDRAWFREMLEADHDMLGRNGEHANTELPAVIGMAAYADLAGIPAYRRGTLNFLRWMRDGHQFANGAISGKSAYPKPLDYGSELFNNAGLLDRQINGTPGHQDHQSGESCCSHNLNKITRSAICWTADSSWGDAFENRFVNAVIAQQNAETGMLVYNLNLKQKSHKAFSTPEDSFWCCCGTGIDAWSSLTNGSYFHNGDNRLWVNNFLSGTVRWAAAGMQLTQRTHFPDDGRVELIIDRAAQRPIRIACRIPAWAKNATVTLNGRPAADRPVPGNFFDIERIWQVGDHVVLDLPFEIRTEHLIDRPEYVAVKYGPNLLVPVDPGDLVFDGDAASLRAALARTFHQPCGFHARINGRTIAFKPIRAVTQEEYAGYVRLSRPPAERPLDAVIIGHPASEAAHNATGDQLVAGTAFGVNWVETAGERLDYTLQVDPQAPTFLKCWYWGGDAADETTVRLFDIAVSSSQGLVEHVIATQSLDNEAPGQWWHVVYPIPTRLTANREKITVSFRPKGLYGKHGRAGRFFGKVQSHRYDT